MVGGAVNKGYDGISWAQVFQILDHFKHNGWHLLILKPGNSRLAMNEKPKLTLMYRPEARDGVLHFIGALWVHLGIKPDLQSPCYTSIKHHS